MPEGSRPKPKSSTAKRYAGSSTGATGPTPGWTTGPASFSRGFAQQAHATPNTRHTGGHKQTYDEFAGSTYGGARRQRSGGFEYYRTTPQPPPKPAHFDDDHESYDQFRQHRAGESAYRTSQRQANTTPAGTPKSTSTRKAYSTVGGQRDPSAQAPDFNIGAYIKERRAKEEEQARRDEEAARLKEEEKLKREEAAIRAERARREEHRARDNEEKSRRRRTEERRAAEMAEEIRRAEEDARRAEEDETRRRGHWGQADSQFSRNEFRPDPPLFPGNVRDEDLLRTVEEQLAEGQRKSKSASTTASRSHSRRSPTKSGVRRDGGFSTSNGHSDGWGKAGNISDPAGSFHYFTPADDGEGLSYHEKILKREREKKAAEERVEQEREQQREQQRRWEDMLRGGDGSKGYQGHGRTKSETQPRDRPSTPDRPRTSGHESPISGTSKRESPSADTSNSKRRNNSTEFRYLFCFNFECVVKLTCHVKI